MKKEQILKQYFGYSAFWEGQEELVDNILSGKDVMGIMPTGAGKSICFQVPALMFNGITLVVSPLISLMKDQVQALITNGVRVAFINSSLTYNQIINVIENAKNGKYKIIYIAPERLDTAEFLKFSQNASITEDTQKILSCIFRMNQRFGIKMVIDTLRGSKAEKILKSGLDKIQTYGIMAAVKEKRIRVIINYLILNEYLMLTNSEFTVVKLTTKSKELLQNGEKLMMKIAKEEQIAIKPVKQGVAVDNDLFNKLRELRFKLAAEQKVPAYIIFSDATLVDMCGKMPANDAEFLTVSGVGKMKLEAYGKNFLEVINNFDNCEISQAIPSTHNLTEICSFIKETIELSDESISISMFTDKINALLLNLCDKKISAQKVADYLVFQGYLEIETNDGKNIKIATTKGEGIGIKTILKVKQNGESYKQNFYDITAQEFLVDNIEPIIVSIAE